MDSPELTWRRRNARNAHDHVTSSPVESAFHKKPRYRSIVLEDSSSSEDEGEFEEEGEEEEDSEKEYGDVLGCEFKQNEIKRLMRLVAGGRVDEVS